MGPSCVLVCIVPRLFIHTWIGRGVSVPICLGRAIPFAVFSSLSLARSLAAFCVH